MLTALNEAMVKVLTPPKNAPSIVAVPPIPNKANPVVTKKVTTNTLAAAFIALDIRYSPY